MFTSFAISSLPAGEIDPHLSATLEQLNSEDEISIIITLADQLDISSYRGNNKGQRRSGINKALRDKANKTQKSLKNFLQQKNARKIKSFWIFNGIAATVKAGAVDELAGQPEVQSVRLDVTMRLSSPLPAQAGVSEWNLNTINAPTLWALGHTGTGVVIASMDTGVDVDHPDIGPRWRGGSNSWFDPHGQHSSPYDSSSDGHGTGTMGVMVGGNAGGSAIGVAPGATWIAVKLFNDAGEALYSDIHAGFQWLLDPDDNAGTDDAPDVVNNSWGYDVLAGQCFIEFQSDVQALKASGIAVVFSAGNSGPNASTSVSPANYPESFAVGGVDSTLTIALTSSRGPSPIACGGGIFPEIVAPGVNVRTADRTLGGIFPDSYAYVSGSSIAAPHVAGAMALMISANSLITVAELETSITQSADDLGDSGPDNVYGNGLLDVTAAYSLFTGNSIMSVNVTGNGTGTITSNPIGIDCPGKCVGEYPDGTFVTLTAVSAVNSKFTGWSGACTGEEKSCQVTMDQVRDVTASFYSFPWSLFVPAITM